MSSGDTIKFSFLQLSDLRLHGIDALSLHLSPGKRQQRVEESLESFAEAIKAAKERELDAVLIPGNFFDAETVSVKTITRVQNILAELGEIPAYISPGAIDPIYKDSLYQVPALKARGLKPWPENVHIFQKQELESIQLPSKPNVRVCGYAVDKSKVLEARDFPTLDEHDRGVLNILLCSLPLAHSTSFSSEELQEWSRDSAFSYVAVSGPLNECRSRGEDGRVLAAATGTFMGQSDHELGPRKAFFVELSRTLAGKHELLIEPVEFDSRRIVGCRFDLSGRTPASWEAELDQALERINLRPETDILLLELTGSYPVGTEQNLLAHVYKKSFYHVRCVDKTRPNYLSTLSPENNIERSLIDIMNRLFQECSRETDSGKSDEELAIIDDALYFGMEALREGKVSIRNAD